MDYGCLSPFVEKYKRSISEEVCAYIILETLKGIDALHKMKIVHGGIRSENIYLNNMGDIKLAGFG